MLAHAAIMVRLVAGKQTGLVNSGCGGPDESVGDSRAARADGMGGARRVLSRLGWWRAAVCLVSSRGSAVQMGAMAFRQPGRGRPIIIVVFETLWWQGRRVLF